MPDFPEILKKIALENKFGKITKANFYPDVKFVELKNNSKFSALYDSLISRAENATLKKSRVGQISSSSKSN